MSRNSGPKPTNKKVLSKNVSRRPTKRRAAKTVSEVSPDGAQGRRKEGFVKRWKPKSEGILTHGRRCGMVHGQLADNANSHTQMTDENFRGFPRRVRQTRAAVDVVGNGLQGVVSRYDDKFVTRLVVEMTSLSAC